MDSSRLPIEVELVFEVMPCNALRTAQDAGPPHPCTYFRSSGRYHSYDYQLEGPPPSPKIEQPIDYLGRATLVPEILTGCRKAPVLAVGINPNLPGWWPARHRWLNPVFDDYRQYAHYFRYRAKDKIELTPEDDRAYGRLGTSDPFSPVELNVPVDATGQREIHGRLQSQSMYLAYQGLLDDLSKRMGWPESTLEVGEDLAYGNMVACPSARWTTVADPKDPALPPMTVAGRDGIVTECFHKRRYFLRQLFQSLPPVIIILSQATANAFNAELESRFIAGAPKADEPLEQLGAREVRLLYGDLPDGSSLEARVIYSPHATGDARHFAAARARVVDQLVDEARRGNLIRNPATGHLGRGRGACVFCPMLEIGPCDYAAELVPMTPVAQLTADSPVQELQAEKGAQEALLSRVSLPVVGSAWGSSDEMEGGFRDG